MSNKYHNLDDNELITLCKSGDNEAYSALIARYLFAVRSRANVYANSGIDFEDLVQEGFIGLIKAVDGYENGFQTTFSTFAYMCVDRNILSAVKKSLAKKQIPKSALVFLDETDNLSSFDNENPESIVISNENLKVLKDKIAKRLSKFEQSVLEYYLMGFTYKKIADTLGCSQKAVDNAIQRLRNKLK